MRLLNGKQLNIVELPMPNEVIYEEPAITRFLCKFLYFQSICNVPTYRCTGIKVLDIIQQCFPEEGCRY
jgi:agmatine deiminase